MIGPAYGGGVSGGNGDGGLTGPFTVVTPINGWAQSANAGNALLQYRYNEHTVELVGEIVKAPTVTSEVLALLPLAVVPSALMAITVGYSDQDTVASYTGRIIIADGTDDGYPGFASVYFVSHTGDLETATWRLFLNIRYTLDDLGAVA